MRTLVVVIFGPIRDAGSGVSASSSDRLRWRQSEVPVCRICANMPIVWPAGTNYTIWAFDVISYLLILMCDDERYHFAGVSALVWVLDERNF
jgi:hypothetical protein